MVTYIHAKLMHKQNLFYFKLLGVAHARKSRQSLPNCQKSFLMLTSTKLMSIKTRNLQQKLVSDACRRFSSIRTGKKSTKFRVQTSQKLNRKSSNLDDCKDSTTSFYNVILKWFLAFLKFK
jgi:hypothetical protein